MSHKRLIALAVGTLALAFIGYEGYKAYVTYESNVANATAQAQQGGGSSNVESDAVAQSLANISNILGGIAAGSQSAPPTIIFPSNSTQSQNPMTPPASNSSPLFNLAQSTLNNPSILATYPVATQLQVQAVLSGSVDQNTGAIIPANLNPATNPLINQGGATRNNLIIAQNNKAIAATQGSPAFATVNQGRATVNALRSAGLLPA